MIYWVINGLYINEISSSKLVGLYWRVNGVCIDVVCIVDFVESGRENIFSPSKSVDINHWDSICWEGKRVKEEAYVLSLDEAKLGFYIVGTL